VSGIPNKNTNMKPIDKPTILIIDHAGLSASVSAENSDINLHQMLEMIRSCITGVGFSEAQWEQVIMDMANEIDDKYAMSDN
jgi:hypothetical protein